MANRIGLPQYTLLIEIELSICHSSAQEKPGKDLDIASLTSSERAFYRQRTQVQL